MSATATTPTRAPGPTPTPEPTMRPLPAAGVTLLAFTAAFCLARASGPAPAASPASGAVEVAATLEVMLDGPDLFVDLDAAPGAVLAVAQAGLAVGEYAPNAVKKAVVGVGHAHKDQIAHMVRMQLPGADPDSPDAADALAIALCHAFHVQSAGRLAAALEAGR